MVSRRRIRSVYEGTELNTGITHRPFDSEAEAAASLVFAKVPLDRVEIVRDAPITTAVTGWA